MLLFYADMVTFSLQFLMFRFCKLIEERQYTKVNGRVQQEKTKNFKKQFSIFLFFFLVTGCIKPAVLGKEAFPWWEITPNFQAKCHLRLTQWHTLVVCLSSKCLTNK